MRTYTRAEVDEEIWRAFRRLADVLNLKVSAGELAKELNRRTPGVNWAGCSKFHLAHEIALGKHGLRTDDVIRDLRERYPIKERRFW